jgi:cytochrome c551/c552
MRKVLKNAIPATILTAGLLWAGVTASYAKPAYAKAENKACTFCHVTTGKPELNEAGDYYAAHDHSLKGYTPAKQ